MSGRTAAGHSLHVVDVGYSDLQVARGVDAALSEAPNGEPHTYVIDGDAFRHCDGVWGEDGDGATADLDQPGTLGGLLALVREVWGPTSSVVHVLDGDGWALCTSGGCLGLPDLKSGRGTQFHRSYAEALVAALEAAPV